MSTTPSGLVSPDTPFGSTPPPEASTPPPRPPANIPTFITPSEPHSIPPVWEHVIDVLMKLPTTTAEGQNKELKKHNATTRSNPPPKRTVDTHDTDPSLEHPPTDTPTGDPNPPQIPLQTLIWTTLNPVKPSPLMTPPLSTSWIPILPHTLLIKPTSIMSQNTLLLTMGPLLIGEPMVALLVLM